MTIEDEVRAIIKNVMPFTDHKAKDEAVAALMRLMEPPATSASLERQIEAVRSALEHTYSWGDELEAALETLRWVQSIQGKETK